METIYLQIIATAFFLPVQKSDVPCDIVVFRERRRKKNVEKYSFLRAFFAAWTSGEIARLLEILLNAQIRTSPTVSHEESHKHQ